MFFFTDTPVTTNSVPLDSTRTTTAVTSGPKMSSTVTSSG